MAFQAEMNVTVQGPLSEESSGKTFGEIIRDYEVEPDVKWRFGKPNYARVNKLYFDNRSKVHPEGSLESIVSKVVKNWEVESHHIEDPAQWKTMDISKLTVQVNGGACADAKLLSDAGPYNLLLGDTPSYAGSELTLVQSNQTWNQVFTEGYAWECLEVLAGPPQVVFKWRHFGKFTGQYTDRNGKSWKGDGSILNLIGLCIAKVNASLQIEALDIYYNPEDLLKPLHANGPVDDQVPVVADEGDGKTIDKPCQQQCHVM